MTARVALIGANGYGLAHRRAMVDLQERGLLELVALCDLAPVRDEPDAPVPPGARVFTDHRELLHSTAVDVVVVATPPHTHLPIAIAAAEAGADVLVEKPPLLSLAEHRALTEALARAGRACQVGFQALGSAALIELAAVIASGRLGAVNAVSALGCWQRPDAYYQRSRWAGKRAVDGRPSLDGALANPFAHAVMQSLAVAESAAGDPVWPVELELERYRARQIEVDDTAALRLRLDSGPPVMVAVTLCADEFEDPRVLVHTESGTARLDYAGDLLWLPGETEPRQVPGRVGLLENLLAHRRAGTRLLAPLHRTAGFTAVVEAIAAAPMPTAVADAYLAVQGAGPQRVVTVTGVSEVVRRAADRLALPSELGVAWAVPPHRARPATATHLQTGADPSLR